MKKFIQLPLYLTILSTFNAQAQTPELQSVTVVGTVLDSPAAVEVTEYGTPFSIVTDQAIRQQNALDFNAALKNVPGVLTSQTTMLGQGTGASLFIRGRGASHPSPDMAIQFDGVPRMGALYGQTLGDGIALNTVGGMEIFKSPAPLQFGSGYALVNVQPKKMTDEGTMGNTGLSVGSHQSVDENVAVGYKSGNFDIYAAQSWLSTKGHREHSRANQANYYVNMGYKFIDQWEVRLILNRVDAQTQYPRAENDNSDETLPRYDTTTTFSTLSLNNSYDWAEGYLKFYWNDTKFEILNENAGAANSEQKVKLYGFRAREDFHIWKGSEIRFGFDLDRQVLDNYQRFVNGDPVKHWNFPEITLFSPYAGISQMFGDQDGWYIKPNAGLRLYVNNEFKNKVAPEASLTLGYKDTSLIFNYARGVNYPSPVILQAGILNPDFKWEGIKPEIVDHYELTLSHNIRDRFVASLSAFYDEGKDRFRAYMFGPSPTVWNDPVGKYEIKGLEFAVTAKPLDNLELFGSATWMKAKARGSNGVTAGDWVDHLPYTPEFMFKAGVDWRVFEAVRFYADIQHMQGLYGGNTMRPAGFGISNATQKLDNITLVNARLSYGFNYSPLRIKDSEVFVSVNNLFNKKYQYVVGYPMPGTTFMIGTNIQFR